MNTIVVLEGYFYLHVFFIVINELFQLYNIFFYV